MNVNFFFFIEPVPFFENAKNKSRKNNLNYHFMIHKVNESLFIYKFKKKIKIKLMFM